MSIPPRLPPDVTPSKPTDPAVARWFYDKYWNAPCMPIQGKGLLRYIDRFIMTFCIPEGFESIYELDRKALDCSFQQACIDNGIECAPPNATDLPLLMLSLSAVLHEESATISYSLGLEVYDDQVLVRTVDTLRYDVRASIQCFRAYIRIFFLETLGYAPSDCFLGSLLADMQTLVKEFAGIYHSINPEL